MSTGKKTYLDLEFGDIILIEFNKTEGREQKGFRPAVVLSDPKSQLSLNGLVVVAPITSTHRNFITRVYIEDSNLKGDILLDQIRTFDLKNRKIKYIKKAHPKITNECSVIFHALFEKMLWPR